MSIKSLITIALCFVSISSFALDDKELKEVTRSAETGDAKAQLKLGQHYFANRNVLNVLETISNSGDLGKAYRWTMKAAYQGLPEAQVELGDRYRSESNELCKKEALYWYKKAAEQNYPSAFEKLGDYYELNDDIEEATRWYQKYLDCLYTKNGRIDGLTKMFLPKYVSKYSPIIDESIKALRYESYYTITGRTKDDWDTISESQNPSRTVYIKIYDDYIEVDGETFYYDKTFKGYKMYRARKGILGTASGDSYGIDKNFNLIHQSLGGLLKAYIWTDAYKGKADDEDVDKTCNDPFFNTDYREGSYHYDLEFVTETECESEDENGIAVPIGIYRSKSNPDDYFFSFSTSQMGINYNQAFRFVKENNTIKAHDYSYKGIDTLRGTYFYFNF